MSSLPKFLLLTAVVFGLSFQSIENQIEKQLQDLNNLVSLTASSTRPVPSPPEQPQKQSLPATPPATSKSDTPQAPKPTQSLLRKDSKSDSSGISFLTMLVLIIVGVLAVGAAYVYYKYTHWVPRSRRPNYRDIKNGATDDNSDTLSQSGSVTKQQASDNTAGEQSDSSPRKVSKYKMKIGETSSSANNPS
jgi:hypothetical protein